MKFLLRLSLIILSFSCNRKITGGASSAIKEYITGNKENTWVFIMAGQSNMAGRGQVEPQDTITDKRILSINKTGRLIMAKEPLHWYEPERTGLDCGYSFGKTLIKNLPDSISILIIPTAVGGSSVSQWIGDSLYRGVKLLSNFKEKTEIAKRFGVIKGILWHQGESDANAKNIPLYNKRLAELFTKFRWIAEDNSLPVLLGELGSFSKTPQQFKAINESLHIYTLHDKNCTVITTADLKHKGDSLHFNSEGQRMMGKRFAEAFMKKFYNSGIPVE
jgi:hypothetical protein